MRSDLPTGTVTFLFTDIVGSTPLWEREPERMRGALDRHHSILREAIEAQGGHVYKIIGDAFQAAFDVPARAVEAALAAQRSLIAETWPTSAPIQVRMGLHTGQAEAEEVDYATTHTLNRVARIMSTAHGGQVLISVEVTDLLRDSLPPNLSLRDMGQHRMKGMTQLEHLYQLLAPDLPADFPPLKSLETTPNNLPIQLTSFVGRVRELSETAGLLGVTRLLTLTGPGGTGKTRLSLQLGNDSQPAFANGVWLVELAPLADAGLIVQAVASVFSLREIAGRSLHDLLTDYLRAKRLLLILDNCEHLIEGCARLVDQLLHACPHLKIVVSSREALGIAGETAYRVPSLSLPDAQPAIPNLDSLAQCEAVQLLLDRARAVQPHFTLTAQNASAVTKICQRLDGIPLALELAAARVKVLTAEQIAARLDDRFRLLTGGSRAALPRQQTLRALIDWSYDLLPEGERALLRQLSVFAGGWLLAAAESVCAAPDILDPLSHLVDKSLVVVEEQAGEARYRLLETIRQYAREKLVEAGEAVSLRERHLDYFLRFAEQVDQNIFTPDGRLWLERATAERDNMRAALEWALESQPETAMRLISALGEFWVARNFETEGRGWCEAALARVKALPPLAEGSDAARERMMARTKVLAALAFMVIQRGDHRAGRAAAEESVALARQLGDMQRLALSLRTLGLAATFSGDPALGLASAQEGEAICRRTGNKAALLSLLMALGTITTVVHGDERQARAYLEESISLARETGFYWASGFAEFGLARLAALYGNLDEARQRAERIIALNRSLGNRMGIVNVQSELAHALRRHGDLEEALVIYRETIRGWQDFGHRAAVAHQLECCAFIAGAQGQIERAARLLGAAEALRELSGSPMTPVERVEYERAVSSVRAAMDESGFAKSWAAGQASPMDEAITFAVEQNPP